MRIYQKYGLAGAMAALSMVATVSAKDYQVAAADLVVRLSEEGKIVAATMGRTGLVRPLQAYTQLSGCERVGPVLVRQSDRGVECVRKLTHTASRGECTLTERFVPGEGSVRWEVEIAGGGDAWSTPVETRIEWPQATFPAKLWVAQSGEPGPLPPLHFVGNDRGGRVLTWSDPLRLLPFGNMRLGYGGRETVPGFSLPMATIIEERADSGLTLALSPEDVPATMEFQAHADGFLVFSRENLRISKRDLVRLKMDLVAHDGDWRPALGWMVGRYPEYFNPPNPQAANIAGCGAFCSSYAGDLDAAKLQAMGARVNWGYGFTFPYVGMYLPYVEAGREWISFEGRNESSRTLNELALKWRAAGIHTLAEFVTTEWGYKTLDGKRIPTDDKVIRSVTASAFAEPDAWRDATAFLTNKLSGSVLFGNDGKPVFSPLDIPLCNVVVDPAEPVFAEFLVDQARRFVTEVPACEGICIDRMDWLDLNNPRRDDGVSWVAGKPVRSLRVSWLRITEQLGQVLHRAGKSMFVNPHIKRLDLMRHVDGFFDEYGYLPFNNNADAFLGLHKPVMAWTPGDDYLRQDPDAFFQRHLYLGIYPMAPFPENGTPVPWLHAIQPGAWAENQYRDYGPLLDANQGKRWVLKAHVITVKDELAMANLFEVAHGYAVPIVFGGRNAKATVVLRKFDGLPEQPLCEARHPGSDKWVPVTTVSTGSTIELDVPLVRGCAMVRVTSR
jgi:hypothetical protein